MQQWRDQTYLHESVKQRGHYFDLCVKSDIIGLTELINHHRGTWNVPPSNNSMPRFISNPVEEATELRRRRRGCDRGQSTQASRWTVLEPLQKSGANTTHKASHRQNGPLVCNIGYPRLLEKSTGFQKNVKVIYKNAYWPAGYFTLHSLDPTHP